jgi:ergothioneine biosynthesis protein EgtB
MRRLRSVTPANSAAPSEELATRLRGTRRRTLELCEPLSPEDMMVQSSPESSPAKWHLAHTAWFFESFVLKEFLPGYTLFNSDFPWLFNSYYQSFAAFPEKRLRASFSRPPLDEVLRFRGYVDGALEDLFSRTVHPEALRRIELGVNHEEQHQELLLTDILHALFTNPLRPAYLPLGPGDEFRAQTARGEAPALRDLRFDGGMYEAGARGEGFCFDNELGRHRVWLEPFALGSRLVTCAEYAAFIADGGYRRPELWLSAGWDAVQANGWRAPLYWTESGNRWTIFTLHGEQPLSALKSAPVSHVSYYEADAFARWAGLRLPTEFEWEAAAAGLPANGNLLDSGRMQPAPAHDPDSPDQPSQGRVQRQLFEFPVQRVEAPAQLFGDCWEWTSSAYLPYPGFKPLPGSLGEYNGKFMSGQMVLRGGSCVTPRAHIRTTYRNFFPPETRWQFSGIRLAS